jgi:hypothetical protein
MKILLSLLAAAVLLGCSGVDVNRDYDTSVDFQALDSYGWRPPSPKAGASANPISDDRIRAAVDASLAAKGFRKGDDPDFLVDAAYTVDREYEDRVRSGVGVGVGTGSGGSFGGLSVGIGTGGLDHEMETITIDVLDRSSKLLWRGSTRKRLVKREDPRQAAADMRKTVDAILKKFPPPNGSRT